MTARARSGNKSVSLIDVSTYLPGEPIGADYYASRIDKERRKRHLVQQLEALGLQVTLTPTAA